MTAQFFFVLAALPSVALAGATPASNAELLCMVMDNTRSIAPCVPSEADHTVTIDIRPVGEDMAAVCHNIQSALEKQGMFFDGANWRLIITTPASGGKTVASCDLPRTSN